jgi:hypothetical protein
VGTVAQLSDKPEAPGTSIQKPLQNEKAAANAAAFFRAQAWLA